MIRLITSYRFATVAIAMMLLSLFAIVVVFPDRSPARYTAWFVALMALVAVSMGVCTGRRAAREFSAMRAARRGRSEVPRAYSRQVVIESPLPPGDTITAVRKAIRRSDWGIGRQPAPDVLAFEKGRAGVWGSIAFHAGLIVVIAGIGSGMMFGVRGMFALTEGEVFTGSSSAMKNLSAGIFSDTSITSHTQISLLRFDKQYRVGGSATPAAEVRILDDGLEVPAVIHANNGYDGRAGTLFIGDKWGFSTAIDIMDTAGTVLFSGLIRLATTFDDRNVRFRDRIELGRGRSLEVEFYPSPRKTGTAVASKGTDLKNPCILLTLSGNGRVLAQEYLAVNQSVQHGGLVMAFPQVRHWAQFEFVHDPGIPLLYAGFALALCGLSLRLLFVKKKMVVIVSTGEAGAFVTVSGWSEKYQHALQEEIEACVSRIREILDSDGEEAVNTGEIGSIQLVPQECS